jgi:predicted transcriptional regulator
MYTERVHVRVTPEQRRRLDARADEERRSVGAVIRDAIDRYFLAAPRSRVAAAEHLLATDAPVADWDEMKADIVAAPPPREVVRSRTGVGEKTSHTLGFALT